MRNANAQGSSAYTIKNYQELFTELNGADPNFPNDPWVISRVTLPDGREYHFFYNSYGEIARVELPTGGAYEYDYLATSGVRLISPPPGQPGSYEYEVYRGITERRVYSDASELILDSKTTYSRVETSQTYPAPSFTTVDVNTFSGAGSLLMHEKHYFTDTAYHSFAPDAIAYAPYLAGKEYRTEFYDLGGNVVRTTDYQYAQRAAVSWWSSWRFGGVAYYEPPNDTRMTDVTATVQDVSPVLRSQRHTEYDQYNNATDLYEYDFGSGAVGSLVRRTHTGYLGGNYASDTSIHIRSLPSDHWVSTDSAGTNKNARTTYEYDNYNQTTSDGFHAPLKNQPNITGLDGSFITTYYTRGNVTKTTRAVSFDTNGNVASSVSGYAQYDIAGNVVETIDPRSTVSAIIATTFDFSDAYGYANSNAEGNETPLPSELPSTAHTYAFATKVTNALNQNSYIQYDYYLSKPINSEDANSIVAQGRYDDFLDRPTSIDVGMFANSQLQRHTSFFYSDSSHLITTQSDQTALNDGVLTSTVVYDGLGRTTETRTSTPEGTTYSKLEFDAMGRVNRTYNPYRATSDATYGYNDASYDSLGRLLTVTTFDGNNAFTGAVTTSYSGNQVTVTDPAGKTRRSITDGLGRLTRVDEPDSTGSLGTVGSPTQPTSYVYDVLDDLTTVTQGTQPSRSFLYDSLKRLTDATNPESGHVLYTYDENGNLETKIDARSITTTYLYDMLNRVTSRSYTNDTQSTPAVAYFYDGQTVPTLPAGAPTFNRGSSIGRLVAVAYGVGNTGTYQGYDQLGRVVQSIQVTETQATGSPNPQAYGMTYSYNLASEMLTEAYPSGRVVQTEYDSAGRVAGIRNQGATFYYAGATSSDATNRIQYAPQGTVSVTKLGNGKWEHTNFNSRLQPTQIGLGTSGTDSSVLKLDYGYGTTTNNGNVISQTITAPGLTLNQCYGYDSLNRLSSAEERSGATNCSGTQQWKQAFSYDRFGNRNFDAANTTSNVLGPNPSISQTTNRIASGPNYGYDNAGNLTSDPTTPVNGVVYDAENRQTQYTKTGQATNQYFYDGDGHRVKKIDSSGTTVFVYNAGGQLIAEYTSGAPSGSGTSYLMSDHLGSTRVATDGNGNVKARHDYLPFGEEIQAGIGGRLVGQGYVADNLRQRFTQKERDAETGLDYFGERYYSSAQGRFTSVDPLGASAIVADPQSFNRYIYVVNNPLRYVDPDGLDAENPWSSLTDEEKRRLASKLTFVNDRNNPTKVELAAAGKVFNDKVTVKKDGVLDVKLTEANIAGVQNFVKAFGGDSKIWNEIGEVRQVLANGDGKQSDIQFTVTNRENFLQALTDATDAEGNARFIYLGKDFFGHIDSTRGLGFGVTDPSAHVENYPVEGKWNVHWDPTSYYTKRSLKELLLDVMPGGYLRRPAAGALHSSRASVSSVNSFLKREFPTPQK